MMFLSESKAGGKRAHGTVFADLDCFTATDTLFFPEALP
jgi:hypothetical protein